jgi:Tfp pilus assembly protein PilX
MKAIVKKLIYRKSCGVAMLAALIFVAIFSAFAISMAALSTTNAQISSQQHKVNSALAAAQSGLDCGKYLIAQLPAQASTNDNTVSATEAGIVWDSLCAKITSTPISNKTAIVNGNEVNIPSISYGGNAAFKITFTYNSNSDPRTITVKSTGTDGQVTRSASIVKEITKSADVLKYAIASRGRMWITGDSTIHGSVYSAWNLSTSQLTQLTALDAQVKAKMAAGTLNSTSFATLVTSLSLSATNRTTVLNELLAGTLSPEKAAARCIGFMSTSSLSVAPFNMTGDSTILGTINTCWTKDQIEPKSWQFETWDAGKNPIYRTDSSGNIIYEKDSSGNFLLDDYGDKIKSRVVSSGDEIQGVCAGINYGEAPQNLAGMNISDYDTTVYYNKTKTVNGGNGDITTSSTTRTEYFPNGVNSNGTNNYQKSVSGSLALTRHVYTNQTFTNRRLKASDNALFQNCTFNGVLFVDCYGNVATNAGSSTYNNVRFDSCTFNGTIVSNTPQTFNWQKNTLYFTGSATFPEDSSADTKILAPHFNVNLGNANPVAGTDNVLHGAIVGGIVDVRGNAEVFGTIISMADTSSYTSGYVTNIGATLNDGGSETVAIGDIGTINITPDPAKLLPSGIKTPIVIIDKLDSYSEQ